jgi:hypothetical protein
MHPYAFSKDMGPLNHTDVGILYYRTDNSFSKEMVDKGLIPSCVLLKTFCTQANLSVFMRSGAPAAHDVSNGKS